MKHPLQKLTRPLSAWLSGNSADPEPRAHSRDEEADYRSYVRQCPHAMFVVDETGRYVDVNPAAADMLGYSETELLSLHIPDLLHPSSVEAGLRHFQELNRKGKATTELMFRRKDQQSGWWSLSAIKLSETRFLGFCTDITQQKQAEQALLEAEWKFRALFEKGPIGVAYHRVIFDDTGKPVNYLFLDANETYRRLTGVDPRGKLVTEAFPGIENDPFDWIGTFARVARTGEQIRFEQFLQSNGRWYDCVGYQYQPDHFVAAFLEITDRKKAEEELRRTQEDVRRQNSLFESLLKLLPTGVFMVSAPSGEPLLANDTALRLLGRGILPNASRENLSEIYKAFKSGGSTPYPVDEMPIVRGMKGEHSTVDDLIVERPDGSRRRLEITGSPVTDDQGQVWASLVSFTDITERKKAEDALRRNETRLAKMFANIGDVVAIFDEAGINRFKSPNIERWFGWKPEEIVGSSTWDNIHPDDMDHVRMAMTKLQANPGRPVTGECRYRCKDNTYKWTEYTAVNLIHDPDIQGILLNYHDISERKKEEEAKAILEAQFQQSQKMDSIGRLAGGVAHDFNNMLAATLLQLNLLSSNTTLDEEARQALRDLAEGTKRAANLTRQLLMFSRRAPVQLKPTDLNQTIENLLKMLRRVIGEEYTLELSTRGRVSPVNADVGMIEQVLLNLTVNARDAMPKGGPVAIRTYNQEWTPQDCQGHPKRRPGLFACLEVVDTGCGIPPAILATIFEPFFTTKEIGKGTGLGLSTVDGIVNQHHGWVEVDSELGRGSSFRVYLPALAMEAAATDSEKAEGETIGGDETILLVEDDAAVRVIARRGLEQLGYTVLVADSPVAALSVWQAHASKVQLLLSDMVMPGGMNGLELVKRLRERNPTLPAIIMSGYSKDLTKRSGELKDGIEFLPKPFAMPDLASVLRKLLDSP